MSARSTPRAHRRIASTALALGALLAPATRARATPAPDSVAVLANADDPASVALARAYADARDVPLSQVCALPMPLTEDVPLDVFVASVLDPLRACLGDAEARIESVVVMRGVPLRVTLPAHGGARLSITAALGTWRSTLEADGTPLLGTAPGMTADCGGTPCYAARVRNPFALEPFAAGFTRTVGGVVHRPVLATMLHGRTNADARRLLDVALAADAAGNVPGDVLLMRGADPARGSLDRSYAAVASELSARGITARIEDFASDLDAGAPLSGFVTGTAALGTTIEANTFSPGALVDNLTSFGAVPENFRATGEVQVSIARWVARGVAGVHGTVDEPLSNVFPSRLFLVDYADGATLAEAFHGNLPYTYWLNLVLGDPMLAPFARRPAVTLEGIADGARLAEGAPIVARAEAPEGRELESLALYVDGVEIGRAEGPATSLALDACVAPRAAGDVHVLAVARTRWAPEATRPAPAAGWAAARATSASTDGTCAPDVPDAGLATADAAHTDAGVAGPSAGAAGCGCGVARPRRGEALRALASALALAFAARLSARRRRAGTR